MKHEAPIQESLKADRKNTEEAELKTIPNHKQNGSIPSFDSFQV